MTDPVRTGRDVERLKRGTERRYRETVSEMPDADEVAHDGQEKMIENDDGSSDLLKRMGSQWVRLSKSLNGLEVKVRDQIPGLEITVDGKRYRVKLEEVV
jgi:hypothetical protein